MKKLLLFNSPKWVFLLILLPLMFIPFGFGLHLATVWEQTIGFWGVILGSLVGTTGYMLALFWLLYRRANGIKE